MANKKSLWITRRLSEKTLERAQIDYDCVINFDANQLANKNLQSVVQNLMQYYHVIQKFLRAI